MPKVIQPRRHDKELSVEEFWKIRDEGRQQRAPNAFHAYREEEVQQRHRYQKPSEQAKTFNPLALTLRTTPDAPATDLFAVASQDEATCVGEYLSSVQGKVNAAIQGVKKWTLGRQSILYNLERIYSLLWQHLYLEESWILLQAIIRDSRGASLTVWLQSGLKSLAAAATESCSANFSKPFFRNLFDTLCILMETHYEEIIDNLQAFFLQLAQQFMKHNNKYIRKFSVQAFSYVLANLPQQRYQNFLQHLVQKQGEGFFDEQLALADLLLQRLKVVKGCLTTASMAHFLVQLETLQSIFSESKEGESAFLVIASEYIGLVLSSLNVKQGAQESQLLFDFLYVVKALIAFAQKNIQHRYASILVMGLSNLLAGYQADRKKFTPHTSAQNHYLRQVWEVLGNFFKANVEHFEPRQQLNHAIAVLTLKSGPDFYYSSAIINYCKQQQETTKTIIRYIYEYQEQLESNIMEVVLLLSKDILRGFVLQDKETANVYTLIVLMKRFGINKLIELSWLELTDQEICAKIDRASFEDDLIVILRLLVYIRLTATSQQSILERIAAVYSKFMTPFENHIKELSLGSAGSQLEGTQFFNCAYFTREIILYAHHEIGWLSHVFNIYEAFAILTQHLEQTIQPSSLWDELITSRPSALTILSAKGRFDGASSNNQLISNLLSSRNREVRYSSLLVVSQQFKHSFSSTLLQWLLAIDQNVIDLDNERQIKRIFCNVEQHLASLPEELQNSEQIERLYSILLKWCLGFAFTGFKLIEIAFISFLRCLLDTNMHSQCPELMRQTLMPFLQYYTYRHSRQYEFDISAEAPQSHLTNAFTLCTNPNIEALVKEDLQITSLETVEWIGLERIAEAVKTSKQAKKHLAAPLHAMITAYFQIQFRRQANTIESSAEAQTTPPKAFLLSVKIRFLVTILKLCPSGFLPPFECLHFTRDVFFELDGVRNIKRNNWESMWQRKAGQKRKEIAEIASTTINLEHLSAEEQRMYVSYLWKDMLEANRHKKRIILDHIRNYLPSAPPLLFALLQQHLHIPTLQSSVDQQTVNRVVRRLRLMNRKSLLNGMYILKAMLLHLRQEVSNEGRLKTISLFILSLIQIVYTEASPSSNDEEDEEGGESEQQEQDEAAETSQSFEYKQHRKELQKLLQTLFANHALEVQSITQLLEFLFVNTKINLAKSARLSVPGMLHILRIISAQKEYGVVLVSALNGEVITMLNEMVRADEHNQRPLRACFDIYLQVMAALLLSPEQQLDQRDDLFQSQIEEKMRVHAAATLSALLSHIRAGSSRHETAIENEKQQARRKEQQSLTLLRLISHLMQLQEEQPEQEWEGFIWEQLNRIAKIKRILTSQHCQKLSLLIVIFSMYLRLRTSALPTAFLKKIISILPCIRDPEQRLSILQLMISNSRELGLSQCSVQLVSKMGQIKKTALVVSMDFPAFFEACNEYTQLNASFKLIDHEYFLYNLICYADHEELSVRRAVSTACKSFLSAIERRMSTEAMPGQDEPEDPQTGAVFLCLKIFRVFIDLLPKQGVQQHEQVFWNTVENIELFITWFTAHAEAITQLLPNSNIALFPALATAGEESYFKLLGSISEASKLKGLRLISTTLQAIPEETKQAMVEWTEADAAFPNPISKVVLPVLEYLILKPTEHNSEGIKSNLSSTLSKISLELLPLISSFLRQSTLKRQLKRFVSKLKFTETENKRNVALIRIIGALIDGISGERVNDKLQTFLEQHGFEQFHQKITQFSKAISNEAQIDNDSESDDEVPNPAKKRERIPDYFQRLEELESEQAINRNFLHFDRKMMELQGEEEGEEQAFSTFLRKHVLLPLRAMLLKESKGKKQEETSKSQVLLSVAVTKVLLRLPLDLFLREFQKVVSRLGRLLKKREADVRENARTCLCEIARAVGPQLLYAIILELKFHLKDNFDRHVLNYSVFKVLQALDLTGGALDYCLPLLLPSVVDEVFGQSAGEKELVEKREVKTLKIEAKKQKGLDILQLLCRAISADRIAYIIDFLEKYLREHLVTEANLGKYDHLLGAVTAGLAHNPSALDPRNAATLLPLLAEPVNRLRQQIKQLTWDDSAKHQNTVRKEWKRVKAGKEQILSLQEEAGRNKSIFKRMSKEVGQRRNQEIIASSLIQFYLALLSFFLRRQVFTPALTAHPDLAAHLLTLLSFLTECVDQRDNRLVTKSLKTLHMALSWKNSDLQSDTSERFKSMKKQTSRKILLLVQQLTLSDEELLKECFVFLNDLVSEVAVTLEVLPSFISVIRLHTPTSEDQPHLPETYQLLRTLLFKCPQYLYHPLLDDLRLFVRTQLPNCRNKDIRELAASILSVYLRPRKVIEPALQAFNLSQQKHARSQLDYGKRLQEELTFYLSNLECPGQEAVLRLLQEFVDNREVDEIQTYGELLVLGLLTARTNQVQRQREHPADSLIIKILRSINPGKVGALIEKSLLWSAQPRNSSIRLCGVSLLRIILQHSHIKLTHAFLQKHVLSSAGVLAKAAHILKQEAQCLEAGQKEEQGGRKIDSQWNDILNQMEVENSKYESDPAVTELLLLLTHLFQHTSLPNTHSASLPSVIVPCWQLLHSKEAALVSTLVNCLLKVSLLPALRELLGQAIQDPKNPLSVRKIASSLIFNHNNADIIEPLLLKIITEEAKIGANSNNLTAISWLLVGLALKSHIKATMYQPVLPTILRLLNSLSLSKQSEDLDFRRRMLGEPNFQDKLLELSIKLSSNTLIAFESKSIVEETTQILKEAMGVAEYFRAVGEFEDRKRMKRETEKARIAEMAITNPQEYIEEKRGRKRL